MFVFTFMIIIIIYLSVSFLLLFIISFRVETGCHSLHIYMRREYIDIIEAQNISLLLSPYYSHRIQ